MSADERQVPADVELRDQVGGDRARRMGFLVHTYGFTAAWAFVAVLIGVVLPACP